MLQLSQTQQPIAQRTESSTVVLQTEKATVEELKMLSRRSRLNSDRGVLNTLES